MLRLTKGGSAPIQKEGTGPKSSQDAAEVEGASPAHFGKTRFCKRCCGERRVGWNEGARRGGEGGIVRGVQGVVGGGGDGGEAFW